jgi:hypothetical protein
MLEHKLAGSPAAEFPSGFREPAAVFGRATFCLCISHISAVNNFCFRINPHIWVLGRPRQGGGSIRCPTPVAGVTMNARWPARRSLPRDAAAGARALRDEGRVRCRRSLSHAAARLPVMQGARSAPSGRSRNRALPEKPTSGGLVIPIIPGHLQNCGYPVSYGRREFRMG